MNDDSDTVTRTDQEWKRTLTDEQYRILRQKGTEPPFSGKYIAMKKDGFFHCAACGRRLFSSKTKYESGSGWPSFWEAHEKNAVELREDTSHGMVRTEVVCSRCGSHLGHVFDDGPQDKTGKRYCINSAALNFTDE